jgi:hypothetical protein
MAASRQTATSSRIFLRSTRWTAYALRCWLFTAPMTRVSRSAKPNRWWRGCGHWAVPSNSCGWKTRDTRSRSCATSCWRTRWRSTSCAATSWVKRASTGTARRESSGGSTCSAQPPLPGRGRAVADQVGDARPAAPRPNWGRAATARRAVARQRGPRGEGGSRNERQDLRRAAPGAGSLIELRRSQCTSPAGNVSQEL